MVEADDCHGGVLPGRQCRQCHPDRAELRLSLRSFDPEVRRKLRTGVERMTPVVKAAFGEAARFESAMAPGVSASEDFAAYMETGTTTADARERCCSHCRC